MCRNSLTRRIPEFDQHEFELVDLAIGAAPFLVGREAFDALHQHTAIPGPIERNELTLLRQASPEALKIVLGALVLVRRSDRVNLETTWIEGPAKAANEAALAGGIPSLKHKERPLWGPEIRLLDALKRPLERRQTPLVVSKVQVGVFDDLRKPRAMRDNEILKVHCLRHILIRLNVRDAYLRVTHARLTVRLKWFSD